VAAGGCPDKEEAFNSEESLGKKGQKSNEENRRQKLVARIMPREKAKLGK